MSDCYKECVIKLSVIYLKGNLPYFTIYKTKKNPLHLSLLYLITPIYQQDI